MKLNEDNTITLSLRETQEYMTKIVNPKYKYLERLRKFDAVHRKLENIKTDIEHIKQRQNGLIKALKSKDNQWVSTRNLDTSYARFLWTVEGCNEYSPEEVKEIEASYQLYKMLLKNRRFKESDESSQSLSEMPEQ